MGDPYVAVVEAELDRLAADLARVTAERNAAFDARDMHLTALLNLLARIHRDGGHHTGRVGLEQSRQDADSIVARCFAERDEARAECERLRGLVDGMKRAATQLIFDRGVAERERDTALARLAEVEGERDALRVAAVLNPGTSLHGSSITDIAADRDQWRARCEAAERERDEWKVRAWTVEDPVGGRPRLVVDVERDTAEAIATWLHSVGGATDRPTHNNYQLAADIRGGAWRKEGK